MLAREPYTGDLPFGNYPSFGLSTGAMTLWWDGSGRCFEIKPGDVLMFDGKGIVPAYDPPIRLHNFTIKGEEARYILSNGETVEAFDSDAKENEID